MKIEPRMSENTASVISLKISELSGLNNGGWIIFLK
jgi:hypothetical protein